MLCQLGEESAADRMKAFSDYTMAKRVAGETEVIDGRWRQATGGSGEEEGGGREKGTGVG